MSRESAQERIRALREKYASSTIDIGASNESSTRLILIDEVLRALGWRVEEFRPESRVSSGWIDYLVTVDRIGRFVVEAKRNGHTFSTPQPQLKETEYPISYFKRAFKSAFTTVLDQATRYALEAGVPYIVITNGSEWMVGQVVSLANQDANSLRGYYFGNILSERCNFELFWDLLSRQSVLSGALEESLSHLNSAPSSDILVAQNETGALEWKTPRSDPSLREFYVQFFTDITDESRRHMLERCFVTHSRLDQYQGDLSRALRDAAPAFLPPSTEEVSPSEGQQELLDTSIDKSGRLILVTGSVGCGKSTLVTRALVETRKKDSALNRNLIVLKVDLIAEVEQEGIDVVSTLWRYIDHEWKIAEPSSYDLDRLRKYFGQEIERLRREELADIIRADESVFLREEANLLRTLRSDPEEFFQRCWRYYRQKHIGIAVVIDNVDKASSGFQQKVYTFADRLCRLTGATVILTMREATFFRGQDGGFLDVKPQDRVLHLQSPNLEAVIARRIQYIESELKEDHRMSEWRRSHEWEPFNRAIQRYASVLKRTFLSSSRDGRTILGYLAALSWHDVRLFLEVLRRLHIQMGTEETEWTRDEVLTALTSTNSAGKYPPAIPNVFRPPFPNYNCYFLRIRVLLFLLHGVSNSDMRKGVSLDRVQLFTRLYGYHTRWTESAIEELVRERLVECLELPSASEVTKGYRLASGHTFRASPLGIVILQQIMDNPVYLSLIGNDLPFHSTLAFEGYRSALMDLLSVLPDHQFERDSVSTLINSRLESHVVGYLLAAYRDEQPSAILRAKHPQVAVIEGILTKSLDGLRVYESPSRTLAAHLLESSGQLELFTGDNASDTIEGSPGILDRVPIPPNIRELKLGRSEAAPLILWALVALKSEGIRLASGVEITKVINEYLLDDHHQRYHNNISRALRGPSLQGQSWLLVDNSLGYRRTRFGLTENWQEHWTNIFGSIPPEV